MNIQHFSRKVAAEIKRLLNNRKYEASETGIHLANGVKAGGVFSMYVNGVPVAKTHNIVVAEGLAYMAAAALDGGSASTNFYFLPFSGNVTPQSNLTAASAPATLTEFVNYTEATRPLWNKVRSGASLTNGASVALISISAANQTVRGAALVTSNDKSATTGILLSAGRFPNDRTGLGVGDALGLQYDFALQDDGV